MNLNPNLLKLIIWVVVMFSLWSCIDKPSKTKLLVQTIWKFNGMTSTSSDSLVQEKLKNNKRFLADHELRFKGDQTFLSLFPSSADVNGNSKGSWKFSLDQTKLIMVNNGNESTWEIEKLDEKTLEIKRQDPTLKADFHYAYLKK